MRPAGAGFVRVGACQRMGGSLVVVVSLLTAARPGPAPAQGPAALEHGPSRRGGPPGEGSSTARALPAVAAGNATVVRAEDVVSAAVAHDRRLRAAGQGVRALDARAAQAAAAGRPRLSAEARFSRYEGLEDVTVGGILAIPGVEERYSAAATVVQPVYSGGRISGGRRAAEFERRSAAFALDAMKDDVVLQALAAYWAWSKACGAVETLASAERRILSRCDETRSREAAGLATQNERLAAEVLLDRTRLRLADAHRGVETARLQVRRITGLDLPPGASPLPAPSAPDATIAEQAAAEAAALSARPELRAARAAVDAAGQGVAIARSARRPQLSLVGRIEQANPNPLFFPPEDKWKGDAFVGAVMAWDICDGGMAAAAVEEAEARLEQARLAAEQAADDIRFEVRAGRINLASALEALRVAARGEASARLNLESVSELWKAGLARYSEVLDGESKYTDAQYETAAARADAALALAAMERAVGAPAARAP